ncbi:hypothetical protein FRC07_000198 [Ceratobasidium sp. 392]|nr:hypothetical protein FRC07_000198 [Ceratobasidium sp. 392]
MSGVKRKAPPGTTSAESSRTKQQRLPNTAQDYDLLHKIIAKSDQSALRKALTAAVDSASPSELQLFKKFLGSLVTWARNPRHCVRCHESYIEGENNEQACQIQHDEEVYCGDNVSDDYPHLEAESVNIGNEYCERMRYPCCGERWREGNLKVEPSGICIQTRHTIDPTKVHYYQNEEVDEWADRDIRWRNKNSNVVTCEENRCFGS